LIVKCAAIGAPRLVVHTASQPNPAPSTSAEAVHGRNR
jgi:hypothetical protein